MSDMFRVFCTRWTTVGGFLAIKMQMEPAGQRDHSDSGSLAWYTSAQEGKTEVRNASKNTESSYFSSNLHLICDDFYQTCSDTGVKMVSKR